MDSKSNAKQFDLAVDGKVLTEAEFVEHMIDHFIAQNPEGKRARDDLRKALPDPETQPDQFQLTICAAKICRLLPTSTGPEPLSFLLDKIMSVYGLEPKDRMDVMMRSLGDEVQVVSARASADDPEGMESALEEIAAHVRKRMEEEEKEADTIH